MFCIWYNANVSFEFKYAIAVQRLAGRVKKCMMGLECVSLAPMPSPCMNVKWPAVPS